MQQAARTQVVDVGERGEEEQAFDARGEADQVEQELASMLTRLEAVDVLDRVDPLEAELALLADRRNAFDRCERLVALGRLRNIGVEQREVELHVQCFLIQLAREVHACFGRIHVLVQVQHQVVRHDRVAGGEERDQTMDQVAIRVGHLLVEVRRIEREIHFLHRPRVADRRAIHLVELRILHGPKGQLEAGVEDVGIAGDRRSGHRVPRNKKMSERTKCAKNRQADEANRRDTQPSRRRVSRTCVRSYMGLLAGFAVLGVLERAEHRGFGLFLRVGHGADGVGDEVDAELTVVFAMRVAGRERR